MINPKSEAELAEAVASAKGPLRIQGGGTRPIGNPVTGEALTTSGMSGITLYEPGALTLVARSGTPMAEIEAALDAENQMLAFEPMDHRTLLGTQGTPTTGGVVAANVSGPRRVQAGACRDSLIGVRYVDGTGTIIKNGGRVMKNVTGYDLVKLMAGSYGTLGVLSEVAFKVLPKPDATSVLLINGLSVTEGIAAMAKALSSPFEVSGAAHTPSGVDGHPVTMIRLEGFENSVSYRAEQLTSMFKDAADITIESDPKRTHTGWKWVRDVEAFKDATAVWRVSIKASEAALMMESGIWQTLACDALFDWGGGLLWVGASEDQLSANANYDGSGETDAHTGAEVLHHALQDYVRLTGGHTTLIKGPEALRAAVPTFQPEVAPLAKLAGDLRKQYDPKGILNPGLMG